jgi:hypothetical protein
VASRLVWTDGNRDALLRASRAGDVVLFIGTQTEETDAPERGRLLGLAEFARNEIESSDVLDFTSLKRQPSTRMAACDGLNRCRWSAPGDFVEPPRLTEVLNAQLPYSAAVRAVLLNASDTIRTVRVNVPHERLVIRV